MNAEARANWIAESDPHHGNRLLANAITALAQAQAAPAPAAPRAPTYIESQTAFVEANARRARAQGAARIVAQRAQMVASEAYVAERLEREASAARAALISADRVARASVALEAARKQAILDERDAERDRFRRAEASAIESRADHERWLRVRALCAVALAAAPELTPPAPKPILKLGL